jgi:hypothetical protein
MDDVDGFRQRLAAAGIRLPDEMLPLLAIVAGPLVTALDELATLDLGDAEPFVATPTLVRDADA